ncbi:MAG: GNAT family N-acetyltransferase [Actinobacteria bacterium]|nr:GNAT family N-acetyltransferase [Actinomycetota bacterium]
MLRRYRPDDLDALLGILGDPETMRYYAHPFTAEESKLWIDRQLDRYERDGFGLWAMDLREDGRFVGNCGPTAQMVDGDREVEIGWHVHRSLWGRGLATEAGAACVGYAFERLDLDHVISLVRPENVASWRVAEKLGMWVDRTTMHGGYVHRVYTVSREAWDRPTPG